MAQEAASGIPAPEGGIVRAWIDVALRPRFETFQRWFPLMTVRWRLLSLVTTLILIGIEGLVIVTTFPAYSSQAIHALTLHTVLAYLFSPGGEFQFACFVAAAIAALYAIPAAVALISARSLGPYSIRFKRVFRPWIQAQPAVCVHLLVAVLAIWVFGLLGLLMSSSDLMSTILSAIYVTLAIVLPGRSWILSYKALSAGSGRSQFRAGLAAAIPGLLIWLLPALLGHPVL